MYAENIMNEEILNLEFEGFYGVFIAHKSCLFMEIRGWRVNLSL
jgi:hypothetical protein